MGRRDCSQDWKQEAAALRFTPSPPPSILSSHPSRLLVLR